MWAIKEVLMFIKKEINADNFVNYLNDKNENPYGVLKTLYGIFRLKKVKKMYPAYRLEEKKSEEAIMYLCDFINHCSDDLAKVVYKYKDKIDSLFNSIKNLFESVDDKTFYKQGAMYSSRYDLSIHNDIFCSEKYSLNLILEKNVACRYHKRHLLSDVLQLLFSDMSDATRLAIEVVD